MEVLGGPERRWRWTVKRKLAMVRESREPRKPVSTVTRQHGVSPSQSFRRRNLYQDRHLLVAKADEDVVPASELVGVLKQLRETQRMSGKTMRNGILGDAVGYGRARKSIAHALLLPEGCS